MPIRQADLALAHRLADAAGEAIRPYFRGELGTEMKADHSPVTLADRAAEAAMRRILDAEAPGGLANLLLLRRKGKVQPPTPT